jgi:hypothetical protein
MMKKTTLEIGSVKGLALYINRHVLGTAKKKATTREEKDALDYELNSLREFRSRLDLLLRAKSKTGKGVAAPQLKLRGNQFGNLVVDPVALQAGRLRAFDGGRLVFEAPADQTLYDLLTKRFVKARRYTPAAVEAFKKLVELAGLPVNGRHSKKHKLLRGGAIQFYNDPDALVERLQLLTASKAAGNTGLDNEISAILDELMRTGAVPKELVVQLNRSLFA